MPNETTIPHARYRATRRFASLDGWRAAAIIAVVFHHTLANHFAYPLAQQGKQGVMLFFVISGFLIVTLILRDQAFSLPRFWGRRVLRIFPVYYATLGLYVALVWATDRTTAASAFWANLPFFATFTGNWFAMAPPGATVTFFFSWSLAAEEQFYLLWPLAEKLVTDARAKVALLGGLIALSATLGAAPVPGTLGGRILASMPLAILLGTALAYILHSPRSFWLAHALLGRRYSALACLGLSCAALACAPALGRLSDATAALSFMALIGSCVIREDHALASVLRWQPLAYVGSVSYGMYMLHMLAVNVVRHVVPSAPALHFVGGSLLSVALASVSFYALELPCLRLKERLFRRHELPTRARQPALGASPTNYPPASEAMQHG